MVFGDFLCIPGLVLLGFLCSAMGVIIVLLIFLYLTRDLLCEE